MDSLATHVSPIDRAVQSLATFSSSKVRDNDDWHSQFATEVDEEQSAQSPQASSKTSPSKSSVERAQSEGPTSHKMKGTQEGSVLTSEAARVIQRLTPRFTPFLRPSTSHEDIYTSFSFDKPQPKPLDFSRKTGQHPAPSIPVLEPEPVSNVATVLEPCHFSSIGPKTTDITHNCEGMLAQIGASDSLAPSGASSTLVTSMEGDSLGAHGDTNQAFQSSEVQVATSPSADGGSELVHSPVDAGSSLMSKRTQTYGTSDPTARSSSPRGPGKVTKLQQKLSMKKGRIQMKAQHPMDSTTGLSYEDTLGVLLVRYKTEKLERDEARIALQAKETELEDLRDISNAIYHQLQQGRQREKSQQAELRKFQEVMPRWETQVKKLSDYVQTLTEDHLILRDDARAIRDRQVSLQTDKSDLTSALHDVHQTVQQDHTKTKKVLVEARHHMEVLETTISDQGARLREGAGLLDAERERRSHLEGDISELATNYQYLISVLTEHRKNTTEKLDDLLTKSEQVQTVISMPNQDHLEPVLVEVLSLLKELREVDVVRPDDLRKLDASVTSYAERITTSLAMRQEASASGEASQNEFASEVRERLQAMSATITTEQALAEQVTDLREMKATFRERLQATENALVDARQQVICLQNKHQSQCNSYSTLEREVIELRSQPQESPHIIFRIQELEIQNKGLLLRNETYQKEVGEVSRQLHEKIEDVSRNDTHLADLQSQIEGLQAEKLLFEQQKATNEDQQFTILEQTKKELWTAASLEKVKIESSHQNQLHQLRQHITDVEAKLKQTTDQMNRSQAQIHAAETEAGHTSSLLANLQAEKSIQAEVSAALESRVVQLDIETKEKDERLAHLEMTIESTKKDLQAKDIRIQTLNGVEEKLKSITRDHDAKDAQILRLTTTNSLSTPVNSAQLSISKDTDQPKRKANRAEKRLPSVVEDSQPNDVQIGAVTKPSPARSKIATPLRTQSHPQGNSTVPSSPLEDFDDMLDDLGDLVGLFPPTPVPTAGKTDSLKRRATQDMSKSVVKGTADVTPSKTLNSVYESRSTTRKSIHFSQPAIGMHGSTESSTTSQSHRTDLATSESRHEQDSQRQETEIRPTSQRRGILKEPTGGKRSASIPSFDHPDTRGTNKRVKGLGPVIPDSQSPQGSRIPARNHRPAKLNSRKKPKDDKYSRRFSQELSQDL